MPSPLDRFRRTKQPLQPFLRADDANALDAESVASALGLTVKPEGRHYELSNGMRGTDKGQRLVWCHKDGSGIGDNCALAQTVTGLAFRPALELLLGVEALRPQTPRETTLRPHLRLPRSTEADRAAGRQYLASRGVSEHVLDLAERYGYLSYATAAVLFVGRDEDQRPRSATRRGYLPEDPTPKRDLTGSDKANWPGVIPGDAREVWVVEGGASALALLTLHPTPAPTVLVTGGVHVRAWLDNPHHRALLARAERVVVASERERDGETQARTDAARQRLVEALYQQVSRVEIWMPTEGLKDLGEVLTSGATLTSIGTTTTSSEKDF